MAEKVSAGWKWLAVAALGICVVQTILLGAIFSELQVMQLHLADIAVSARLR